MAHKKESASPPARAVRCLVLIGSGVSTISDEASIPWKRRFGIDAHARIARLATWLERCAFDPGDLSTIGRGEVKYIMIRPISLITTSCMLLILITIALGCGYPEYDKVLGKVIRETSASNFARLFPNPHSYLTGLERARLDPSFVMEAVIGERYHMTMVVPLKIDRKRWEVISTGSPSFILCEFKSIEKEGDIGWHVRYEADSERRFGTNEWAQLLRANGDLRAVGITAVSNGPVSGAREFWKS